MSASNLNEAARDLQERLGRLANGRPPADELVRGGLVVGGHLTDAGKLMLAVLTDAPRVAMGAAGAALVAAPRERSYLEGLVGTGAGWTALPLSAVAFFKSGDGDAAAAGCAALAAAAAAECRRQSWHRTVRVAMAFEAVALGEAAWLAHGVASGFEAAARRVARCECHGEGFAICKGDNCPRRLRPSSPGLTWAFEGERAAAPLLRSRAVLTGPLATLIEAVPDRVARAAARLALGTVADPRERRAYLRELATETNPIGAWMGAVDYLTGARSPRLLRAPAAGLAALATGAAVAARLAPASWNAAPVAKEIGLDAARIHAWRAVLLAEAAYRACGASGDVRADVIRVARCECSDVGRVDCSFASCVAFQPLAEAVAVSDDDQEGSAVGEAQAADLGSALARLGDLRAPVVEPHAEVPSARPTSAEMAMQLVDLFVATGGGDREAAARLVADIAAGRLALPPCFNLKGGTKEQTERAHDLARLLAAAGRRSVS